MGDSTGNRLWQAIKDVNAFRWIFSWPLFAKAGAAMIPLGIAVITFYKGLPWPWVVLLPLLVVISILAILVLILEVADRMKASPYVIDVDVTLDDGFSSEQAITFTNNGEDRLFTAECQIERTNRPPNHPKGRFRLGWADGTNPEIVIPQHLSGRLLIANYEEEHAHTQWRMTIWKLVGEKSVGQWWAVWLYDDANDLPRFELIVTLTAQGAKEPWIRRFVLTPKTRLGPLSLQEVT